MRIHIRASFTYTFCPLVDGRPRVTVAGNVVHLVQVSYGLLENLSSGPDGEPEVFVAPGAEDDHVQRMIRQPRRQQRVLVDSVAACC